MPVASCLRCLLVLLLAAACWPASSAAQVRRCASADGRLIYTDRACADIGATERVPRAAGAGYAPAPYRGGCSRRVNDLVYGLTSAIDTKDVNRLAMFYDWAGMSTRQGYWVMSRLDGLVQRPLVDIMPVYPSTAPVLAEDGSVLDNNLDGYFPQTSVARGAPIGLRVEQTFRNGTTFSRTFFSLRKRMGCWWVRL